MAAYRVRHALFGLLVLVVLAGFAAGCDAASSPTDDTGGSGCDQWCGNGAATVTLGGITTAMSGGGCYDGGSAGVDARFGDWQDLSGQVSSYLRLKAYRAGGPTPAPAATPAVPGDNGNFSPTVDGSVRGIPFILGEDAVVTLNAGGTGSFSGADVNGYGPVTGTFNCS